MSVQSRPIIESDGNNVALRRVIRLIKKLIVKISDSVVEGCMVGEELLDALGAGLVHLLSLLSYPVGYFLSMPEIFQVFTGKPLPMTLPLIFVLHIVLLVYSSYVLCYLPAVGLSFTSTESISFHLITALAIISYYRGVVTDPGQIPSSPDWSDRGDLNKKADNLRFCSREKKWKPQRTHYCSAIGRNVLKMDHYCPWLANCVGFFNHKYFLLFILYATVASGWATVASAHLLATNSAVSLFGSPAVVHSLSAAQVFFLTEGLCISSLVSLVLTPFTAFHLFLVARNQTTLEYCEGQNRTVSYDFGLLYNFAEIFGYNPLLWPLPLATTHGSGIQFPSRPIDDEDPEEEKIRKEFAARGDPHDLERATILPDPTQRTCCIRKWDDSPIHTSSSWLIETCLEINQFRQKLVENFHKILTEEKI